MNPTFGDLTERVLQLLANAPADGRVMIGIVGTPGAGKTTLAENLVRAVGDRLGPGRAAHVPMDGYHLADVTLDRLGLRDRKGAPASFDASGYIALLGRLRANQEPIVYAPGFDRDIEQPIAGSIAVPQATQVIVSEGNYLLLDGEWAPTHALFDQVWYCSVDESVRAERLVARHVRFGKAAEVAAAWIAANDEPNARVIEGTRDRADLQITAD